MRFEISMMVVGVLALALLTAAGAHGHASTSEAALPLHLLLGMGAMMAIALPHLWVLLYLVGTGRALAALPEKDAAGGTARWIAVGAALAALALTVAIAVSGTAAYAGVGGFWHGELFWALLVAQPVALALEWRALARNGRLFARHGA